MSNQNNNNGTDRPPGPFNLVIGSGGSRAILGGSGAILTCHLAGITWNTIGGASGGTIPASLFAAGLSPAELVRGVIDIDFQSMLHRKASWFRLMMALMLKYRYDETRPIKGVFGTRKLEDYINSRVPQWPENFWTVAIDGKDRILFTAKGAFRRTPEGIVTQLAGDLPTVGQAVCATCAVPGILDAVKWQDIHLFDGALGVDGRCPTEVVQDHFGYDASTTIAVDVGEDSVKRSKLLRMLWKMWCRGDCEIEGWGPEKSDGLILIEPPNARFHALRFSLSPDQKWEAVMCGFVGAIDPLTERGLLQGEALTIAQTVRTRFYELRKQRMRSGELGYACEQLLVEHKLL